MKKKSAPSPDDNGLLHVPVHDRDKEGQWKVTGHITVTSEELRKHPTALQKNATPVSKAGQLKKQKAVEWRLELAQSLDRETGLVPPDAKISVAKRFGYAAAAFDVVPEGMGSAFVCELNEAIKGDRSKARAKINAFVQEFFDSYYRGLKRRGCGDGLSAAIRSAVLTPDFDPTTYSTDKALADAILAKLGTPEAERIRNDKDKLLPAFYGRIAQMRKRCGMKLRPRGRPRKIGQPPNS